ncbi:MAG: hypothetical protein WCA35_19275 [Kovacikia sp.]
MVVGATAPGGGAGAETTVGAFTPAGWEETTVGDPRTEGIAAALGGGVEMVVAAPLAPILAAGGGAGGTRGGGGGEMGGRCGSVMMRLLYKVWRGKEGVKRGSSSQNSNSYSDRQFD